MMSELRQVASHLAAHEPLPLHLAVALTDGGIERLWSESEEPDPMLVILHRTKRSLPVRLAISAAALACEKRIPYDEDRREQTMKPPEILDLLDRLDRGAAIINLEAMRAMRDSLVDDEDDADRRDHDLEEQAWAALRYATSAVIQAAMGIDATLTVRLGVRHAITARANQKTLAEWIRALGPPPSVEEIVAASHEVLPE